MPYCPDCGTESQEGQEACASCGAALAVGPAPREERWTSLMRVSSEESAAMVRGLLESAGIECEILGKSFVEMPVPAVEALSRLEIWVPESRSAEALEILDEARVGDMSCPACGRTASAGELSCGSCGAALC